MQDLRVPGQKEKAVAEEVARTRESRTGAPAAAGAPAFFRGSPLKRPAARRVMRAWDGRGPGPTRLEDLTWVAAAERRRRPRRRSEPSVVCWVSNGIACAGARASPFSGVDFAGVRRIIRWSEGSVRRGVGHDGRPMQCEASPSRPPPPGLRWRLGPDGATATPSGLLSAGLDFRA